MHHIESCVESSQHASSAEHLFYLPSASGGDALTLAPRTPTANATTASYTSSSSAHVSFEDSSHSPSDEQVIQKNTCYTNTQRVSTSDIVSLTCANLLCFWLCRLLSYAQTRVTTSARTPTADSETRWQVLAEALRLAKKKSKDSRPRESAATSSAIINSETTIATTSSEMPFRIQPSAARTGTSKLGGVVTSNAALVNGGRGKGGSGGGVSLVSRGGASSVVAAGRGKTGMFSKVKKGFTGFLSELKEELLTDRPDDGP